MRIKLKFAGLFGFAAVVALLAIAVAASAAGASEFKTATFPVTFLGEGLGISTFLSAELNSVTCEHSHSKGSLESSTKAKVTIYYLDKCELIVEKSLAGKFKEACPNILTKELAITPLSKLNGGSESGLLILPATGSELAKFNCTGSNKVEVKVKGGVICESSPIGTLSTKGRVACREEGVHGAQEFTSGENPSKEIVKTSLTAESTISIFKITEKDAQVTYEDLEYSAPIEQTGTGPTYYVIDHGNAFAARMPGTLCSGQVLFKNLGPDTVKIKAESITECKFFKTGCVGVTLKPAEQCITVVEGAGTKPIWELELEFLNLKPKEAFLI